MKYFKKLVGDRIYLSPRNTEDAEIFTKWLNDFQVTDYTGRSSQLLSLAEEKEYLEKNSSQEATFIIVDLNSDTLIGAIGLEQIDHISKIATLGIFIGEADYRSKGYGTEAIKLLLEYGFKYLNLNNIDLRVFEFNSRAIACYKKCGFNEYGRRRKCKFLNGNYYDEILMDILAEEFDGDYIRNKNI